MSKDLYAPQDGKWLFKYPPPGTAIALGEPRVYHPRAKDLLIITFGNGVPMALRCARRIERDMGKRIRVLDLRWLKPLNRDALIKHATACSQVLIVDEGRQTGGLAEEIFTLLDEHGAGNIPKARVTSADTFIPLGDAANHVLMQEDDILAAAHNLLAH